MKTCPKCKTSKSLDDFHKCLAKPDGLACYCKLCAITQAKQNYKENKHNQRNKLLQNSNRYKKILQDIVNDIKVKYGCQFCNEKDGCCLDFHHPNNDKLDSVSAFVAKKNKRKVIDEINKCIVVCANCHRKIHAGKLVINNLPTCHESLDDYFDFKGNKVYFKK